MTEPGASVTGGGGALDGVRVLDLSRVLAGPYAAMMLADLGADVTRVEQPGVGDETRAWGPPWVAAGIDGEGKASSYFLGVNRNKTSVSIDLRTPEGLARVRAMAADADVVLENFRPGTADRLGVGYAQLSAANQGLVYCSISGFGSGEGAHLPGYDLVVQAAGGLMSITGHPETGPVKTGVALVDVITGLHASTGILAALRHRDVTGEGQHVEVSLLVSLLSALTSQSSAYVHTGAVAGPMGNAHPSISPYETVPTADRPLAVAAANDGLFTRMARAIGRLDLLEDPRFVSNPSRVEHRPDLMAELSRTFATRGADDWFTVLVEAGVPAAPVNDISQAVALAESLGLSPVTRPEVPRADLGDGHGVAQVRSPFTMSRTPPRHRTDPPPLA
ncbi:CoA transferase [Nocardioidaceae bacterium]|nr:CoA transferase [Nocardioidaceae bacterium]